MIMPVSKRKRLATAGPGQTPLIPQPIPNIADPITSFLSTCLISGRENFAPKTGEDLFKMILKKIRLTQIPPSITNIRLGSQFPNISRKPITFLGFIIEDKTNPIENSIPIIKFTNKFIFYPAFKRFIINTLTMPVNIKVITATSDLIENLGIPHMPCPLVQPEP